MVVITIYPKSALDVYKKQTLHFSPAIDEACDEIHKACAGVGTDDDALVSILGAKSADERALIAYRYKEKYNTTLRELVKSETSGDFGYLLQLISMSLPDAESHVLYHAMAGVGTTDNLLYPVILGRTSEELDVLKKAFFTKYEKDLNVMMDGELSGDYHTILMTALQGVVVEYKSSFHTAAKAEEDVETIYKAGEGKWGTDSGSFVKTLLAMPPQYIKIVDEKYTEKYGHGLVKAIEAEFSGSSQRALTFFVRLALEPWELLAEQLHNSMKGFGTDEKKLCMLVVRYHAYLPRVKPVFEKNYKISLRELIHSEIGGKFRDLMMHILDAPVSSSIA
jgi:hypothetical protein